MAEEKNITIIHADTLIPGRGAPLHDAVLAYQDNRIEWVGPLSSLPESLKHISAEHVSVLMPGLWDCHAHFFGAHQISLDHFCSVPQPLAGMRSARDALELLNSGYTSVRELGGYGHHLNAAVEDGSLKGPRVYSAISVISQTGGHADCHNTPLREVHDASEHGFFVHLCDGVDECIKAVRLQLRRGAKVIKVCASGGVGSEVDNPNHQQFSDAELKAIVEEASRAERVVAAHCHGLAGIKAALRAGVATIEHGTYLDDDTIKLMVEKNTILVPTRTIIEGGLAMRNAFTEKSYEKLQVTAAVHSKMYEKAIKAGVRIALGSDLGISLPQSPLTHGKNGMELKHAVEAGLSPLQAIEAATATAPDTLGPQAPLSGLLKEGYDADFIALSANPLDDIGVLSNPENVTHVWQAGRLMKGPLMRN